MSFNVHCRRSRRTRWFPFAPLPSKGRRVAQCRRRRGQPKNSDRFRWLQCPKFTWPTERERNRVLMMSHSGKQMIHSSVSEVFGNFLMQRRRFLPECAGRWRNFPAKSSCLHCCGRWPDDATDPPRGGALQNAPLAALFRSLARSSAFFVSVSRLLRSPPLSSSNAAVSRSLGLGAVADRGRLDGAAAFPTDLPQASAKSSCTVSS